jgi:hypothetical protein
VWCALLTEGTCGPCLWSVKVRELDTVSAKPIFRRAETLVVTIDYLERVHRFLWGFWVPFLSGSVNERSIKSVEVENGAITIKDNRREESCQNRLRIV